ncbi:MAG: RNA polymerase sigma factor [Phycisphaerales bacterium]
MPATEPTTCDPGAVLSATAPEELARRAREGSRASFDALVERFAPRLFSFLLRRVGSRQDAEDLTQETFVRAWRRLETYDPERRFSTWLFTIGVRLAAAHYRRRRPETGLIGDQTDHGTDDASADAAARDSGSRLWRLAEETLTRDQFSALWLRYAEDAGVEEIARVLGKSRVGVRVMLFRARARLGRRLEEAGAVDGDTKDEPGVRRPAPTVTVRARRERVGGVA